MKTQVKTEVNLESKENFNELVGDFISDLVFNPYHCTDKLATEIIAKFSDEEVNKVLDLSIDILKTSVLGGEEYKQSFKLVNPKLIHFLAFLGRTNLVEYLIENKEIDINDQTNEDGLSILQCALIGIAKDEIKEDLLNSLLQYEPNLALTDNVQENCLHTAIRKNHSRAIELLLQDIMKLPDNKQEKIFYQENNEYYPPLSLAISNTQKDIVKLFIEYNAPLDHDLTDNSAAQEEQTLIIPIHLALGKESEKRQGILSLLLEAANKRSDEEKNEIINQRDQIGATPLISAALYYPDALELLLNCGAEIDWTDNDDRSALSIAVDVNNKAAVEVLVNHKLVLLKSEDEKNKFLQSVMDIAAKIGQITIMEFLKESYKVRFNFDLIGNIEYSNLESKEKVTLKGFKSAIDDNNLELLEKLVIYTNKEQLVIYTKHWGSRQQTIITYAYEQNKLDAIKIFLKHTDYIIVGEIKTAISMGVQKFEVLRFLLDTIVFSGNYERNKYHYIKLLSDKEDSITKILQNDQVEIFELLTKMRIRIYLSSKELINETNSPGILEVMDKENVIELMDISKKLSDIEKYLSEKNFDKAKNLIQLIVNEHPDNKDLIRTLKLNNCLINGNKTTTFHDIVEIIFFLTDYANIFFINHDFVGLVNLIRNQALPDSNSQENQKFWKQIVYEFYQYTPKIVGIYSSTFTVTDIEVQKSIVQDTKKLIVNILNSEWLGYLKIVILPTDIVKYIATFLLEGLIHQDVVGELVAIVGDKIQRHRDFSAGKIQIKPKETSMDIVDYETEHDAMEIDDYQIREESSKKRLVAESNKNISDKKQKSEAIRQFELLDVKGRINAVLLSPEQKSFTRELFIQRLEKAKQEKIKNQDNMQI